MAEGKKIKLAVPSGSLQELTLEVFRKAGFTFRVSTRSYVPAVDDEEIDALLIRPQEIPRYVEDGVLDLGISGYDWIRENNVNVQEICDLTYSKVGFHPVTVVAAVADASPIQSVKDLQGKRIATEYVGLTQRWLAENGVSAEVEYSWGACEVKVPILADALVVVTETGSSLRAHNLRVLHTLLESTPRLIGNPDSMKDEWKKQKADSLAMLLTGVIQAASLVGLKLNAPRAGLDEVLAALPAMKNPTISPLADDAWVAVETILDQHLIRDLVPQLKRAGARDIVEYPLNKVIY